MKFFSDTFFDAVAERAQAKTLAFKAGVVSNVFKSSEYQDFVHQYPSLTLFTPLKDEYKNVYEGPNYDAVLHRGCIDHLPDVNPRWRELILELASPEFIARFSQATGIEFNSLRAFSWKYGREGCEIKPHLDQAAKSGHALASRLVCLFYFTEKPGDGPGGTAIYDVDQKTVLLEAKDPWNAMVFFEQHKDAWHGYKTLKAHEERRAVAISFNYAKPPVRIKTSSIHKLFCKHCFSKKINPAK